MEKVHNTIRMDTFKTSDFSEFAVIFAAVDELLGLLGLLPLQGRMRAGK